MRVEAHKIKNVQRSIFIKKMDEKILFKESKNDEN